MATLRTDLCDVSEFEGWENIFMSEETCWTKVDEVQEALEKFAIAHPWADHYYAQLDDAMQAAEPSTVSEVLDDIAITFLVDSPELARKAERALAAVRSEELGLSTRL